MGGLLADGQYRVQLTGLIGAAGDAGNTLLPFSSAVFGQLRGDYDGNGSRDVRDRAALLAAFGRAVTAGNAHYDMNGDGKIDVQDYLRWLLG